MQIQDVLHDLNIPFREYGEHEHTTAGWIQIDCPWCPESGTHFRMGISISYHNASCWACGPHGLAFTLAEITRLPYKQMKEMLGGLDRGRIQLRKPTGKLVIPDKVGNILRRHGDYLRGRGFSPKELKRLWGIRGIGRDKRLNWRIWIPILLHGKIVSWTTRTVLEGDDADGSPRYLSASREEEAYPHKDLLYGEDYVRSTVIIVEGPTDVWRIGPGAVGTLGKKWTQAQLTRMARFPNRYVCLDNDPDTQKRAEQLCRELQMFPGKTTNLCLDAEDPGAAGPKEVRQIRELLDNVSEPAYR